VTHKRRQQHTKFTDSLLSVLINNIRLYGISPAPPARGQRQQQQQQQQQEQQQQS
jgi:hypothetical protein